MPPVAERRPTLTTLSALAVTLALAPFLPAQTSPTWDFTNLIPSSGSARVGARLLEEREIVLSCQPEFRTRSTAPPLPAHLQVGAVRQGASPPMSMAVFGNHSFNESFSQLQQAVAPLAGGGFAVVWEEWAWPHRDLRLQVLDGQGHLLLGAEGVALADEPEDEGDAVVIADPEGGAFAAYVRQDSSGTRVIAQRVSRAGVRLWADRGVPVADLRDRESQVEPHLVPTSGGLFVCFSALGRSFKDTSIRCQRLDASGQRTWVPSGIEAGGVPGLRVLPRGVPDGRGGLLVFWRNQRDVYDTEMEPMLMEGQHFRADGKRLWQERGLLVRTTHLAEDNGHSMRFFNVVADGNGGAIIAFNDWTGTTAYVMDVMAQRVSGDGDLFWGQGAVVAASDVHQQHEATIADGDGGAFVAVYKGDSDSHSRLFLYHLGADARHLWSSSGVPLSDRHALALDYGVFGTFDLDVLRVAWVHQLVPYTYEMDVHFARFLSNGVALDPPGGVALTTAPDSQFINGAAFDHEFGSLLAVWDDRQSGDWHNLDTGGALLSEGLSETVRIRARLMSGQSYRASDSP